jgi:hypothetical protein
MPSPQTPVFSIFGEIFFDYLESSMAAGIPIPERIYFNCFILLCKAKEAETPFPEGGMMRKHIIHICTYTYMYIVHVCRERSPAGPLT